MRPQPPRAIRSALVVRAVVAVTVGCTLTCVRHALAAEPKVSDGGMFFAEETVSEADDIIRAIKQSSGRDVYVETYAAVPDDLKADLARDGKEKFYQDWLNRRAKALGVNGVFILMTREPGRVQVGVDRATRRKDFTVKDRESLRETLVTAFRAKDFDRGLLEGLRFVRRRMGENTAPDPGRTVPVLSAVARAAAGVARAAAGEFVR